MDSTIWTDLYNLGPGGGGSPATLYDSDWQEFSLPGPAAGVTYQASLTNEDYCIDMEVNSANSHVVFRDQPCSQETRMTICEIDCHDQGMFSVRSRTCRIILSFCLENNLNDEPFK